MNWRRRQWLQLIGLLLVAVVLWFAFPFLAVFVEGAALNIRRFWWLILLVSLGIWVWWTFAKNRV